MKKLKFWFYSIFITGLVARVVLLTLLPKRPTFFAPDEAAYATLTYWVSNGLDVRNFPDHGNGLYERTRTFILISAIFHRVGFNEYTATRITSLTFSISLSLILLRLFINQLAKSSSPRPFHAYALLFVFAFINLLPSYILWSTLAIRETTSHFFILSSSLVFSKLLFKEPKFKLNALLLIIFVVLAYGVRAQTVWILLAAFLACTWLIREAFLRKLGLTALILFSFTLGTFWTSNTSYLFKSDVPTLTSVATPNEVNIKPFSSDTITAPLRSVSQLDERRLNNQQFAASALTPPICKNNGIRKIFCEVSLIGYQLVSFLLRPLPFIDGGSPLLVLASIENLFWIALFLLVLVLMKVAYKELGLKGFIGDQLVRFYLLFLVTFSASASMYFGNLGTGFRHKSTILWAISLLVLRIVQIIGKGNIKNSLQKLP
jgi:hypothetical protein